MLYDYKPKALALVELGFGNAKFWGVPELEGVSQR